MAKTTITAFNPLVWAIAIVILMVFGAVAYRTVANCESSSFDLLNQLRITLGGCSPVQSDQHRRAEPNVPETTPSPSVSACEKALSFSPVPMCDWWHVENESKVTGGSSSRLKFAGKPLPIIRFSIDAFEYEQQKAQFYKGAVVLRDYREVPAIFFHQRHPSGPESAVDYEQFGIGILPNTLEDQPYHISYGGYFDRLAKKFVLDVLVVTTFTGQTGDRGVFPIKPLARAVKMN